MKRRDFLESTLLAAAVMPAFVERAFACKPASRGGDGSVCASTPFGTKDVEAAFQAAVRANRSLLVLVVPTDATQRWERGRLWGELLNHGTDRELAPLGLTEMVAASLAAVTSLIPLHKAYATEPFALVIEPKINGAQAPVFVDAPGYGPNPWEDGAREAEERIGRQRIAAVAGALRRAIVTAAVEVRVTHEEAALASAVRAAVVAKAKPPRGAEWAVSHGCGVDVEGGPPSMVDCGMGHSPKLSSRFLQFLVDPALER